MPVIKIHNVDRIMMKIQAGEGALKEELLEKYRAAMQRCAGDVVRAAASHLNKPGWELSRAIQVSRLKEYQNRKVLFQAVEPENSKDPAPNTPAAYAWYHEHGYTVTASDAKKPRSGRIIRKGTKRAALRKTEPKRFFKKAADETLPNLRAEIGRINKETKLKLGN